MSLIFIKPIIYLITKGEARHANFAKKKTEILALIRLAVCFHISLIQIREKNLSAGLLFDLAREAAIVTKQSPTKLLVNDRADIALASGADGVHLTSQSLDVKTIRRSFPKEFIVGSSVHTLKQALSAKEQQADFITFSPIFASPGKGKPKGLGLLSEVCRILKPFPVVALGGIDQTNYQAVLENGASGFAAIRFLNDAENLQKIDKTLR